MKTNKSKKMNNFIANKDELDRFIKFLPNVSGSDYFELLHLDRFSAFEKKRDFVYKNKIIDSVTHTLYVSYDSYLFEDLSLWINPNPVCVKNAQHALASKMLDLVHKRNDDGHLFFEMLDYTISKSAHLRYKIFCVEKNAKIEILLNEKREETLWSIFGEYGNTLYHLIECKDAYFLLVNIHLVDLYIAKHNLEKATKIRTDWGENLIENIPADISIKTSVPIPGTYYLGEPVKMMK